tara:strand:- start:192 stop:332 length:141 start_codon:yes stop_codon:yes gene_type:complete
MKEEMIRGKDALGGCFFKCCACFLAGTILLALFIFRGELFWVSKLS